VGSQYNYIFRGLTLRADSTFQFTAETDVVGPCTGRKLYGAWQLSGDTLFLTDLPRPEIIRATEEGSDSDSLTIEILDLHGKKVSGSPKPGIPKLYVNGSEVKLRLGGDWLRIEKDSLHYGPFRFAKNRFSSPLTSIGIFVQGEVVNYTPHNPLSNKFVIQYNLERWQILDRCGSFNRQPFLLRADSLFSSNGEGGFTDLFPMVKVHP
jgi:hypothetical protein